MARVRPPHCGRLPSGWDELAIAPRRNGGLHRPTYRGAVTYPVRTVTADIDRPFADVADFLAEPLNFPRWATGLSSGIARGSPGEGAEPGEWVAASPQGTAYVRFSPPNEYGVADHRVRFPDGSVVDIPLRAIRNGDGTTIVFTLFRLPGVDDDRFDADSDWVRRDLQALKALLEK